MRLPAQQPRRAVVVVTLYLLAVTLGCVGLVLLRGPLLGGLLGAMWAMALTVPAAILAQRPPQA